MQTTISLQDSYTYPMLLITIMLILIIGITIYLLVRKDKVKEEKIPIPKDIEVKDCIGIKEKYIQKLDILEQDLRNKNISVRKAYQSLSGIIRYFVYEVTGIKVQNYTLKEIKKINMPILQELIQEYYIPEFSEELFEDAKEAIDKTRKVIQKWN